MTNDILTTSDARYVQGHDDFAHDADELQRAIDSLRFTSSQTRQGVVYVSGRFFLNHTIRSGDPADQSLRPVCLHGISQTDLHYYGPVVDEPIITMDGTGQGHCTRLVNLFVNCNYRCRGPLLRNQYYQRLADDCQVMYSKTMGLDLPRCWGSSLDRVSVEHARGVQLRLQEGSNSLRDCHFRGWGCWYGDGTDAKRNVELVQFEIQHGTAAAKAKYGRKYSESWPTDIPDDRRAAALVGGPSDWTNCMFEGCHYGARPLIYTTGPSLNFSCTRMEGNYADPKIVLEGNGLATGKFCRFINTHDCSPAFNTQSFLELRGKTFYTEVCGLYSHYLTRSVVHAANGQHTGVAVSEYMGWGETLPTYPVITAAPDAVITPPPPPPA